MSTAAAARVGPARAAASGVVVRALAFCIACPAVLIAASILAKPIGGRAGDVALAAMAATATYGLTRAFVTWEGLRPAEVGIVAGRGSTRRFLVGFAIGLVMTAVQVAICVAAGVLDFARAAGGAAALPGALALYLLASCREELAFRGYPLRVLATRWGVWLAQFAIAAIFAAEHAAAGIGWRNAILGAGVGSLLFGVAAIRTGGLALPIGLHAAWNVGQWAAGLQGEPGLLSARVPAGREGLSSLVQFAAYLAVMVVAIVAFARRRPRASADAD